MCSCTVERISAAVLEALLPFLNETRAAIRRDLEEHKLYVNMTVSQRLSNLEDNIKRNKDDLGQRMEDRLSVLERSLNESMATVSDNVEESLTAHLTQIGAKMDVATSKIFSVSSAINGTIDSKLDLLDSKQDELDMKVMSVNSELEQNILTNITKQLKKTPKASHEALGSCGGEGWRRVAYLDMTDPSTTCPSGWQLTGHSKRTCGKVSTGRLTCDSVFFPVSEGINYTSVCGRIKGYQNSRTDAFEVYHNGDATTIEEPYVSDMAVHDNTSGHLQPVLQAVTLTVKPVPVILLLIGLPHHSWVEIISVNLVSIQSLQEDFFQMILCGMVIVVLLTVHVVHSTILHISPSNSPTLPLMI